MTILNATEARSKLYSGVCQESCRLKFKVMPPFFPQFQIVSFPG